MNTKITLIGSAFAALVLVGCGGGGSSTSSATTGYFVDAPVANADYDCIADGELNKKTGPDGSFTCRNMTQVRFRVGELVLGEIQALPSDANVFPQDLLGVGRNVNDDRVAAMAQLLQAIDSDGNPQNGITIAQESKDMVETETAFNPANVGVYLETASVNPEHIPTKTAALQHLAQNVQSAANAGVSAGTAAANAGVAAGNTAASTGVAAGTTAANAGVTAGSNAANAGVNAGTAAANAGVAAGNTAASTGVAAGTTAANAGVTAGSNAANAGVNAGTTAADAAYAAIH